MSAPPSPVRRASRIADWAGLVAISVASLFLVHRSRDALSVQSLRNLRFAEGASLERSIERYGMLRPPLYPMLLWAAERARLSPFVVTALLHTGALAGIAALARRASPQMPLLVPAAVYALGHFCAVNEHQFTAEAAVAAGLPALALLLSRHRATGSAQPLLGAAALAAVLGLSRLFAAVVAVPALVAAALLPGHASWRRRTALATGAAAVAALPLGVWLVVAHARTGFLTGTDRTAARELPPDVAYWKDLTGVDDHLLIMGRTLLVDLFSPDRYGAHVVVTHPLRPRGLELLALVLLAAAIAAAGFAGRARTHGPPTDGRAPPLSAPTAVVGALAALYLVLTIAVWTLANNDPIYTRFLFPAYGLLCVAAFGVDGALARRGPAWTRLPGLALLCAYVVAQVGRHLYAVPLPTRHELSRGGGPAQAREARGILDVSGTAIVPRW